MDGIIFKSDGLLYRDLVVSITFNDIGSARAPRAAAMVIISVISVAQIALFSSAIARRAEEVKDSPKCPMYSHKLAISEENFSDKFVKSISLHFSREEESISLGQGLFGGSLTG